MVSQQDSTNDQSFCEGDPECAVISDLQFILEVPDLLLVPLTETAVSFIIKFHRKRDNDLLTVPIYVTYSKCVLDKHSIHASPPIHWREYTSLHDRR